MRLAALLLVTALALTAQADVLESNRDLGQQRRLRAWAARLVLPLLEGQL